MAEIKAPKHLHRATKKWYREVVAEWGLEEHHIRILIGACEAWDRGVQAREVIDREGLTYEDRFGAPRARPEIAVERDARISEPSEPRPARSLPRRRATKPPGGVTSSTLRPARRTESGNPRP